MAMYQIDDNDDDDKNCKEIIMQLWIQGKFARMQSLWHLSTTILKYPQHNTMHYNSKISQHQNTSLSQNYIIDTTTLYITKI